VTLAERQFALLRRMASLDPPPCFMGGYAKEALIAGTITRPHEDFDWLLERRDSDLRLAQAEELGFSGLQTIGEAAPGDPFYLVGESGDLKLELGICDEEDGALWMKVHRLFFDVGGRPAPAGWRARLPDGTFDHEPVAIDGVEIRVASPLALYQMEIAIAERGSFGELPERHKETSRLLRERFFPGRSETELAPHVEPLA
jgi:hypothetical protein